MRKFLWGGVALLAFPLASWAADAALLLGTERYEQLGRLARGADVANQAKGLEALGFTVVALPNGRAQNTQEALAEWLAATPEAERLVVALSGRFVHDGKNSWYLTAESPEPVPFALAQTAVSLDSLYQILATRSGQALILLGLEDREATYGYGLSAGIAPPDLPSGVSLIRAAPSTVAAIVEGALSRPGVDLKEALPKDDSLRIYGYQPYGAWTFMPAQAPIPSAPSVTAPVQDTAEQALWEGAKALDTVEAYRNYLTRFPTGPNAAAAEDAIAAIVGEPHRTARLAEEALSLSRDARRKIQQNLTALGFNTRGVDGIFGAGSRAAVTAWQNSIGVTGSGYLSSEQITRLDAQAARRAAEVAAEEERQRQAAAASDHNFWAETGAKGDAPGLRAYLERYPQGLHAANARSRLDEIDGQARAEAQRREDEVWKGVETNDQITAYQDYLSVYPNGRYVTQARNRIAQLQSPSTPRTPAPTDPLQGALQEGLKELGLDPNLVQGLINLQQSR